MSRVADPEPAAQSAAAGAPPFDPDEYRMTLGEHLEELRRRLILALVGFVAMLVVCMALGERLLAWFLRPLMVALQRNHLPPQVYYTEATESFMVYVKASMVCAAAFSAPWMVYQLWQFVAAGLYPQERKYVTKYLPLSIALLIAGMAFLYAYVLPLMLEFLLAFNIGIPVAFDAARADPSAAGAPAVVVPRFDGDPVNPVEGQIWIDGTQERLKLIFGGKLRSVPLASAELATPLITLGKYFSLVVSMLIAFGLSFQTPLIVLALVRTGLVDLAVLKAYRRHVYFGLSILSAVIVPDVVTGMIALWVPLCGLYELGLWLARPVKAKPV
ncbi:MAG TPA: twin-arginine translocase subunit TatC [Tepidisphaeraceae bacterium]|nr:twin-arginine translocase subunit TatC [Tepidisphaeraceae bacterium]